MKKFEYVSHVLNLRIAVEKGKIILEKLPNSWSYDVLDSGEELICEFRTMQEVATRAQAFVKNNPIKKVVAKDLECFVDLDEGIMRVFVRQEEDGTVSLYWSGDYDDSVNNLEELIKNLGEKYYVDKLAYKKDKSHKFKDYFDEKAE